MSRFTNPQASRSPTGHAGQGAQPSQESNTQGRGAQPLQRQQRPAPQQQPAPQLSYPQQPAYSRDEPAQYHDPYAALRADDYHYAPQQPAQTADPYGQYPSPQTAAAQAGYGYPQQYNPYGAPPASPVAGFAAPSAQQLRSDQQQPGYDQWSEPLEVPGNAAYAAAQQEHDYGYDFDPRFQTQSPQAQPPGAQALGYQTPGQQAFGQQAQQGQWGNQEQFSHLGPDGGFDAQRAAYGAAPQSQGGSFDQSYAEDEEEYEELPPTRSWSKIALVVSMFVALGGSLTYAYNSFIGPPTNGATPVVKGEESPVKVKPSDPGGKQFAHSDSKIMDRLGEGGGTPASSQLSASAQQGNGTDAAGGVRKVPVLVVGRDGSIQAPAAAAQAPPQESASVVVPGLTVVDNSGSPLRAAVSVQVPPQVAPQAAPQVQIPAQALSAKTVTAGEAPQVPVVVTPPTGPAKKAKVIAVAPILGADPSAGGAAAAPVADKKAAPVAKKVKVAAAAAATATPAAAAHVPTSGYVAVLASVPASASSRIDALKQFADMQQKYGDLLQNKLPDVQEANLGEKGTYHRLLVGPPGSRDAASQLCTQLKAQGYSGCWVTAY
ncbi:MAG: SPOR domain-containing protein [Hyphomicrobium sp.]|jgi:hypothetical protein